MFARAKFAHACFASIIVMFAVGSVYADDAFTIAVLPDTQNYVIDETNASLFTQQTQWISDQVQLAGNPQNIQFVTHLGDVVSNGSDLASWQRAETSLDILDDVVKYSVVPGNHDYNLSGNKISGAENFVSFFGPERFAGKAWYGGADPSGSNSYQLFNAGGYDFLHLAMEWDPAQNTPFRETSPIMWAQSVIDSHPNTPVILSTHDYVAENPAGRSPVGEDLWDQLVRANDQIFLVLNGHFHGFSFPFGGQHHQTSTNNAGRPVYEILQNYQNFASGGDGWLRLIEFDLTNNQLVFKTYSPVLEQFLSTQVDDFGTFAGEFELDIDFSTRLVPIVTSPTLGDFDLDLDIDGSDFLAWQRGESLRPFSADDLNDWEENYGDLLSLSTGSIAAPEPSTLSAFLVGSTFLITLLNRKPRTVRIQDHNS